MPNLLDECSRLYATRDIYDLLGLKKTASTNEVKRAYHKLSLRVHPDRVTDGEKDAATAKFQVLGKVYTILSDKDKRALYDESGEIDEDDVSLSQDRDWYEYWRLLYTTISVNDIKEFEDKYKGSEEELNDLKSSYVDYGGDMEQILDNVLCATEEDEGRFREILDILIKDEELPSFDNFTNESDKKKKARKRKAKKEAQEAEELKAELGIGSNDSLSALIAQRQQSRAGAADDFFAQLEQKYAQPKAKSKKVTTKR